MSDSQTLIRDYSREPVPDEDAVGAVRIALVVIGFAITLPVLLAGSQIGLALGLGRSVKVFATGGAVLALIGCVTAYIGAKTRLSTYMITQFSFGTHGARAVNLLIAITLFGWYGVTVLLFGEAAHRAMIDVTGVSPGESMFIVIGSLIMVLTTIWGFKGLDRLSLLAVPLMAAFLLAGVWHALDAKDWRSIASAGGEGMTERVATSLVIGSYAVGAMLLPDLTRYARRASDGIVAASLALGVAFPCIFLAAAIPSLAAGEKDLMVIMTSLGMGLPALAMIVFATWTSNANNLYSTSLTLATVFTSQPGWKITVAAGVLGTLVAALGIMDHFVRFLLFLGICIPPIAGVYIADFFFLRRRRYAVEMLDGERRISRSAFAAWILGSLVGYGSTHEVIAGSTVPACDAMVIAFVSYLALKCLPVRAWAMRARARSI